MSLKKIQKVKLREMVKQSLYRSTTGFQEVEVPDFEAIGTRKWLGCQPYASALYSPGIISLRHPQMHILLFVFNI